MTILNLKYPRLSSGDTINWLYTGMNIIYLTKMERLQDLISIQISVTWGLHNIRVHNNYEISWLTYTQTSCNKRQQHLQ